MRKSLGGLFIGRETAAGGCHTFFASRPSRDETERQLPQTGAAVGCEFSCVGRPPAEMPDGDAALEGLSAFLARFCKILNPLFDGILQKLVARGIALALDELPRRYVSREFLTL